MGLAGSPIYILIFKLFFVKICRNLLHVKRFGMIINHHLSWFRKTFQKVKILNMQMMLEQPRYVVNRVTAGDYDCPRKVMNFLTDLHAAFRMLNLRNDFLRKKFDSKSTSLQIV